MISFPLTVPFFAHQGWEGMGFSAGRAQKCVPAEENREQQKNLG